MSSMDWCLHKYIIGLGWSQWCAVLVSVASQGALNRLVRWERHVCLRSQSSSLGLGRKSRVSVMLVVLMGGCVHKFIIQTTIHKVQEKIVTAIAQPGDGLVEIVVEQ